MTFTDALMTETAYILPAGLTWDRWAEIGRTLFRIQRSHLWWIGDWFVYGEDQFGDNAYQEVPGYASETVRNAVWLAKRFPPEHRRPELSFSYHQAVASTEIPPLTANKLLDQAVEEGWNRRELREAAQGNGRPREDCTCPACGAVHKKP